MRVVIVGGVAAGMSAATRLRRLDEHAEIVVLERGPHVSFANCGLPYVVGGVIEDRAALLRDADAMAQRYRLDIRRGTAVVRIDLSARTVHVRAADGTGADIGYERLLLAEGASAAVLEGDGSIPVHTLRTVEDMDALTALVAPDGGGGARRAVVVGAGYIGLEATENLVARGVAVVLVSPGAVLRSLDPEMAGPVERRLRERGVRLARGRAARVERGAVVLADGSCVDGDLVVDAIGIAPDVALARAAGLAIGPAGGIAVDAYQVTSDPAVLAAGDAAEKEDAMTGDPTLVALAGLANRHGRAAADTIAGRGTPAAPALGTAVVGVLGLTIGTFGWTEQRLIAAGRPHRVLHTHPSSHAGYYPGARPMAMKLLVDAETDAILGAQVVGEDGVDKRVDVLATAASAGVTASGLTRLELAYAPQYGSAKDPVNLAGYVAENLATGTVDTVQWHELPAERAAGAAVVDVRSPAEFARGAIPGAVNVPLDELRQRHGELPAGRIVLHCQVGQRGFNAARMLTQLGHDVANLDGGYVTWRAGTEAEREEAA